MAILPSCLLCSNPFTPRNSRQKYCLDCVHKPCELCGAKKDVRARVCKQCDVIEAISRAKSISRKEALPAITCALCDALFTPRNIRQQYCSPCVNKPCPSCGKPKDVRAEKCKQCEFANRIGQPNIKNRRERPPMEQVISDIEAIGLLPEKQYAFGYVIGVTFGDGCVNESTVQSKHTCKNGAVVIQVKQLLHIDLQVTSQDFANRFALQWKSLTGRTTKVGSFVRTFRSSTLKGMPDEYTSRLFRVSIANIAFARYLAHLKYGSRPSELLKFPLEVVRGFVHGMIDSEGYVRPEYTDIANKDIDLLNTLVAMLEMLGYTATVYTSPSQSVAHLRTQYMYHKYDIDVGYF